MRLIDADLAVAKCNEDIEAVKDISQRVDGILDAVMNIHECPTIEERKKGWWKIKRVSKYSSAMNRVDARCSECTVFCSGITPDKTMPYNFCPFCGADMRGDMDD